MTRPQVVDGGDGLQIWWAATNRLNKQSGIADKGWSSRLRAEQGPNNHSPEIEPAYYEILQITLHFDGFLIKT
jgi:hypothetical protein